MDFWFYFLVAFPVVFAISVKIFKPNLINWTEMFTQIFLCLILVVISWNAFRYADAWDTELWNGSISSTEAIKRNCNQSWSMSRDSFCTNQMSKQVRDYPDDEVCTTRDGKKSCTKTPRYHTEYRSIFPWERRYFVKSENLKKEWEIPREDRQGERYPLAFTQLQVGDPVSITHQYVNWIKGAVESIFHEDNQIEQQYVDLIPNYPIALYDQFKVDRVLSVGVKVPDLPDWNYQLGKILGTLGPERQMNAIIVIVDATIADIKYARAVRRAWGGFKKNDAVVFLGVNPASNTLVWTEVLSWSKKDIFNSTLRSKIAEGFGKPLDKVSILNNINAVGMSSYERRSMEEFEFLKDQIPVPTWLIILCSVLSIGGSIGLFRLFMTVDFDPIGDLLASRKSYF